MTEDEQLVHSFFLPERRNRYLEFVKNPKYRRKFLAELAHFRGLDERRKYQIPPSQQTAAGITDLLVRAGGSATCLVISDDKQIDGIRMSVTDALETILGRTSGTFLSCRPGLLAYFENEDGRWILKK